MSGITDTHHHLWDPARRNYPWMTGPAASLRRPYGLDELRSVTSPAGVARTIVVQAAHDEDETEELLATAASSEGLIAGVVGWVDLTAPDLAERLARLRSLPGGELLAGIRHQVHDETDPEWLTRPDVLRGLSMLATAGLVYDLLIRPRELPAARRAVQEVDTLAFVVDHGAKPAIAEGVLEPWSAEIGELARLPNVSCKVSGLVTEADWANWTLTDLRPYTDRLVDVFGADRLMFGSDWPVCTLAASYSDVLQATRECLAELTPGESDAVFTGNAARIYGL
ncbi:amidohydrolase family protein [Phytoactinopolyspora mesophila]|uniref:Amidohydrolase family protein n=1 Tax=Phytoactinopolyspora mesophila TaxID=2650750 RepID=A0A7K3M8T6_9ACTN|nr:amidohydrolase family protein [Phytoactinopolyspora mesophila]NDL59610.1 amidohydrolase family protein [Phytoactinopolyspora mesophila]